MNPYRHAACALLASTLFFPAFATAAEPGCKYLEAARLPLSYSGPDLDITTTGTINGKPATMLVDTGLFDTVLTKTATDRHALALSSTRWDMSGVGGPARIYETRVSGLSIGPASTGPLWLPVLKDFGSRPHYDARVGAPFLLQADMEISLAAKTLKFFRPMGCDDSFLGYWDEHAVVLPLKGQTRGHRRGPANPHFTVVVNGIEMDAIIDTSASTSFVTLNAARRAGLTLDAAQLTRAADAAGIGSGKAARWRTAFKRFEIGHEIVHNAEVGVVDYHDSADVLLGADFLRSHRVLFAMSQKKIYLSYVGGPAFGQRHRLEPWIQGEAIAGNADAQMALATYYREGKLVARDSDLAWQWAERAARGGNPEANILTGHSKLINGEYAEAATRLRAAQDKLLTHPEAALNLYLARVHTGQPELAKTELAAALAAGDDKGWPVPIGDFYLGKLSTAKLLEAAALDARLARERTCRALWAISDWHHAHGDKAALPALAAQRTGAGCPIVAMTRPAPAPKQD